MYPSSFLRIGEICFASRVTAALRPAMVKVTQQKSADGIVARHQAVA